MSLKFGLRYVAVIAAPHVILWYIWARDHSTRLYFVPFFFISEACYKMMSKKIVQILRVSSSTTYMAVFHGAYVRRSMDEVFSRKCQDYIYIYIWIYIYIVILAEIAWGSCAVIFVEGSRNSLLLHIHYFYRYIRTLCQHKESFVNMDLITMASIWLVIRTLCCYLEWVEIGEYIVFWIPVVDF